MPLSITRDVDVVEFSGARRTVRIPHFDVAVLALVAAVIVIAGVWFGATIDALKSAGLTGGTPIQGVGEFIDSIKGNLIWLGVTIAGCGIFLIGGLYLAGHSRAQDYGIKFLVGCLIIAGGTGFIA